MSDDREPSTPAGGGASPPRRAGSRFDPPDTRKPPRILGQGAMTRVLGAPDRQTTGHWCSHCRGIWFGYPFEVTCPICGNRHG